MKRMLLNATMCGVFTLAVAWVQARETTNMPPHTNSHASFKTDAGDCVASTSQFDMDINNVRARILGGGDMWWNFSEPKYEVPKGDGSHPLCSIFAGAVWISGYDAGGNLKCAAQTYREGGNDFWPGPLTNGDVDQATCTQYDRQFNVYGANIAIAQTAYATKGNLTTEGDIPKDVLAWPAIGNQYLATDPSLIGQTFNVTSNLAPFHDADGDGAYDPTKGDYPVIPCRSGDATAYADQMVFWVFNDLGNIHTQTNGQAIGVQVNALAFAFQSTDDINNMTFYKYEIINKSSNNLYQTYVSQWVDPDLGCYSNDRVGCDTTRNLGVCYNGSTPDPDNCQNENGYGSQLPAVGVDFFEGPLADNGAQIGLSSFVYFTNGAVTAQADPSTAAQYRNYQTGYWADGTPFTQGGTGYGGSVPTKFIFPGNPSDGNAWSECQVASQLPANDRRFVQSSGPFTLKPGVSQYITVGAVWVRPSGNGVGLCPDFNNTIGPADDKAQALFNTCFKLLDGPDAPTLQIRELSKQLIINLINPTGNNKGEGYNQVDGSTAQAVNQYLGGNGDSTYKFQGYRLYQVSSPTVSASDLSDVNKAVQIAEVDVKDGVAKIINYIKDPVLGLVPTLEIDGNDAGVTNSFNVTKDYFATGSNSELVNHKTYYYAAIAYAYNNYKQYDPTQPTAGGQLIPYLQGRNNFKVYAAVPHIIDSRNDGTVLNATWGQGVDVKRIEGRGNGGNDLMLSSETIAAILNSGNNFTDTLLYEKGHDPIGFQVTDPVSLKEADFELRFVDSATNLVGGTTKWFLHDLTNGDTIWSDRTLDRPYQQQIVYNNNGDLVDYGFSIKLGTPQAVYTLPGNYLTTGTTPRYIYGADGDASSISYTDSSKPWLTFIKDNGVVDVTNWIRTGVLFTPATGQGGNNPLAAVFDANWYYTSLTPPNGNTTNAGFIYDDSDNVYSNILGGMWAPYCLSANYSNKSASGATPPYVYGPGFKWLYYGSQTPPQNTLDHVASVDVVITPDKSKWSHCIVLETGEDEGINQGNDLFQRSAYNNTLSGKGALKGEIRMHYSKKWNNPNTRDYLVDDPADTGRSWFPGYAINVETGERLNIYFGESSDMGDQNGRDMLWNPTGNVYNPITFPNQTIQQVPYFGGKHFIYVAETKYDEGAAAQKLLLTEYDSIKNVQGGAQPKAVYPFYRTLMWTCIPYLNFGYSFNSDGSNNAAYIPPSEVDIHLRVNTPYHRMLTNGYDGIDSLPRYQFSTKGLGAAEDNASVAKSALDEIKIVPNPYLGYSSYETSQNTSTVKVTNLPNNCTVTIYSLDGTLIRVLNRAIGVDAATNKRIEISDGTEVSEVNVSNTIDWDLKNDKGIPIASGVYLFHVDAPGIGQKTLKWFGAVRPADTSNY
ncbi:MAG TPA: hypothetical protein VG603_14160 [Chitinophagales bacterium]|nr:hypothetical protein [Chitinophagales bacterium]